MNTDEIIETLKPYGRIYIHQADDGSWSVYCNLYIASMTATVISGYAHKSCLSAMRELKENVFKICDAKNKEANHQQTISKP